MTASCGETASCMSSLSQAPPPDGWLLGKFLIKICSKALLHEHREPNAKTTISNMIARGNIHLSPMVGRVQSSTDQNAFPYSCVVALQDCIALPHNT